MPPKGIFQDATFVLCGRLERPAKDVEALITKHGGEMATSVTAKVTHVVSTASEASGTSTKIVLAKAKELPIVIEGFLDACVTAKTLLDTAPFALAKGAKRCAAPKADGKAKPKKKARLSVKTTESVEVLPKADLAGKAAVVLDGESPCDCELVRHSPDTHIDRFYRLQLLAAPTNRTFFVVSHWGSTGSEGRVHITKHTTALDARRLFRGKFRQRTGNKWTKCDAFVAVDGKYCLLERDAGVVAGSGSGEWEYYLHNEVNGKKVGWYSYEEKQNGEMERLWRQFGNCPTMGVRLLQTDYFWYEIDFGKMIQTNRKSGTRRVIRRVLPGAPRTSEAPSAIPEKVAPTKASEAPPESEDEDEPLGAEEEDDDDAGDSCEEAEAAGESDEAPEGKEEEEVKEEEVKLGPTGRAASAASAWAASEAETVADNLDEAFVRLPSMS